MSSPIGKAIRWTACGRLGLLIGAFVLLGTAFVFSTFYASTWAGAVLAAAVRMRQIGYAGWLVFVAAQAIVALVGILPASLLGLAAGAIYGVAIGFALSAAGLMLGAAIAFLLARSTLRPTIERLTQSHVSLLRLDGALVRDGWRLVLLLRASPVLPFSMTSFVIGLSGIDFASYMLGTLASLPALLLYVTIGRLGIDSAASVRSGTSSVRMVLIGVRNYRDQLTYCTHKPNRRTGITAALI